jgi:hypothetical protein
MVLTKTVILDSKSHQAIRHNGTEASYYAQARRGGQFKGDRLAGFATDLRNAGFPLILTEPTEMKLRDARVFIVGGRSDRIPFTDGELLAISHYYDRGGSIFLMANHRGFIAPQNQIASALSIPVKFHDDSVMAKRPTIIGVDHCTSAGCSEGLQFRTGCAMSVLSELCVPMVVDEGRGNGIVAALVENDRCQGGRVFMTTSAGHISSLDDSRVNLYGTKSNATWTMNIVRWLYEEKPRS